MDNKNLDMLFLHPPANIGKANHTLDADVAYTDQFVAFPVGFFNMADRLDKAGFKARILNLGERVYASKRPAAPLVESIISEYNPKMIGMDVHWMIHSAGAIETARIIKNCSPGTNIVLGGISASFFFEEILSKYSCVDYVMVGECDDSIVDLLREIVKEHPSLNLVPNLAYRSGDGIALNPIRVPDISTDIDLTRYDLLLDLPLINPDRALIPFLRGCYRHCCFCAGSKESFAHVMRREKVGVISPHAVVGLMQKNLDKGKDKIYLYGDIRLCGKGYVNDFFDELEKSNVTGAHLVFEFFDLATEDYVRRWSEWAKRKGNTLEVTHSPESGTPALRKRLGKSYSNEQLLEHCKLLVDYGIPQGIYFLLGLPGQTKDAIEETLDLADKIVEIYSSKFGKSDLRHEVVAFNFMQVPDAGSDVFREPERFGFHLDFKGIEGLIEKLRSATHWSESIGYHTDTLSKEELVQSFYHIQKSLLKICHKYHLISDAEMNEGIDKYTQDDQVRHFSMQHPMRARKDTEPVVDDCRLAHDLLGDRAIVQAG